MSLRVSMTVAFSHIALGAQGGSDAHCRWPKPLPDVPCRLGEKMTVYDRWHSARSTTTALRLFRAHHTELNRLFWALNPAMVLSGRSAQTAGDTDATSVVFAITHEETGRIPSPISE